MLLSCIVQKDCPPAYTRGSHWRGAFPLALRQESLYCIPVEAMWEGMTEQRIELPQATLDLLTLRTLALGPEHGWAISERIHQVSSKVLQVQQGSHPLQKRKTQRMRHLQIPSVPSVDVRCEVEE
jgi:hypothetical protein